MSRDGNLRTVFRNHLPHFHWTSVESPMTIAGIPDTHFCFQSKSGWIENKVVRSSDVVKMQPGQPAWLERYARAGGKCFIAVRWPANDDHLFLLAPFAARLLTQTGLRKLPTGFCFGRWPGGPARWQWQQIAEILLGA